MSPLVKQKRPRLPCRDTTIKILPLSTDCCVGSVYHRQRRPVDPQTARLRPELASEILSVGVGHSVVFNFCMKGALKPIRHNGNTVVHQERKSQSTQPIKEALTQAHFSEHIPVGSWLRLGFSVWEETPTVFAFSNASAEMRRRCRE